jgi:hypothetical protein
MDLFPSAFLAKTLGIPHLFNVPVSSAHFSLCLLVFILVQVTVIRVSAPCMLIPNFEGTYCPRFQI